ncbi:MAG: hydroxymethylglutaryl-CoA lyase, partial [Gammaproteobacteria bacterium]|nr:hydroxymethylglutaryl-CoA lyase [Gammaproteobacteria bacterium]
MFGHDFPTRAYINEVATRDGFQSEAVFVPTDEKIRLINQLSRTGLHKIEVTSFVSPRAIPNLCDAEEVMEGIDRNPDVRYVTLVPNEKGAERALACRADEINLVMSVSQSHNLANMRMSCEQSQAQFARIVTLVGKTPMKINGTLATAFGCPFEGLIPASAVMDTIERYLQTGIRSITVADTTGMASPRQVTELCGAIRRTTGMASPRQVTELCGAIR